MSFADTDVDLEPFNIMPFKIFIPEKLPLFPENAAMFNFDIGDQDQLLFRSRHMHNCARSTKTPCQ